MTTSAAGVALFVAFAACVAAQPASPVPSPTPTADVPVYGGAPAVRFGIVATPLGVDPDGHARLLLVTRFVDGAGRPTRILANSDVAWRTSSGFVQWQTRMRYGQPAAIVSVERADDLTATIHVREPELGSVRVVAHPAAWPGPRVVARALGPHLVQIGWFPRARDGVRIDRIDGRGRRRTIVTIAGPSSTYRDALVLPGRHYRYVVARAGARTVALAAVTTPPAPPPTALANVAGKAMWLFFTTNPLDALYYKHLDPDAVVERAVRAGLHYVELRTAYGAYWEIAPEAKPTIDAIIDGLAAHGIGTIGWTVPRDATFDDVAQSVRTAYYRTARGTPLTGVAIDVERGDEFMGAASDGPDALWHYVADVRAALGPGYLIVSTVEDPYLEHITQRDYPYAQLARVSSALQPMAYWHMMRRKRTTPAQVGVLLRASYAKLVREAGRRIPIGIGGQTGAEGPNGYPSADEIVASLDASKSLGALGECFFSWDGTQPYQWDALAAYRW